MKSYCLVFKKLADNTNSKTVKNKGKLMMKSTCSLFGNKKIDFFHKHLVYLIV